MEDNSPPQGFKVSLPIRGMEGVVATVTGYCGIERFNLIKLISKAGGNYVGRMSQSITHLVCWKFEGTKYQLARKFNALIVNHQWIEDCVKAGRLLPEYPYTRQCGHEVGPLKLDASLISEKARHPNQQNDRKEPGVLHTTQILLSQENRNSAVPEPSHGGRRRKLVKKNAMKEPLIITSDSEQEIAGQEDVHEIYHSGAVSNFSRPIDELKFRTVHVRDSTYSESGQDRIEGLVSQERSNSASPEPSHRGRRRRLVKKNMIKESSNSISESKEGSTGLKNFHEPSSSAVSNHSGSENECKLSGLHACGSTCYECGPNRIEILNGDNTVDVNDVLAIDDESLHVKGASSDQVNDNHENRNDIEPTSTRTSMDLSCVICWTNFSATRGVLPCGHRFCYSCIQSWVDYMTSSQKASTCPLCKAAFTSITKVDDAVSSDQKIYSQTLPDNDTRMERIPILPGAETPSFPSHSYGAPVCCRCSCREPEDLLQRCNLCRIQCIHSYCLDPPLLPWTCGNCKDLQRLYQHIRS